MGLKGCEQTDVYFSTDEIDKLSINSLKNIISNLENLLFYLEKLGFTGEFPGMKAMAQDFLFYHSMLALVEARREEMNMNKSKKQEQEIGYG